jgi:hypothetical protein
MGEPEAANPCWPPIAMLNSEVEEFFIRLARVRDKAVGNYGAALISTNS